MNYNKQWVLWHIDTTNNDYKFSEAEFELSDDESWELYGHTELTVGRDCSGKHVINLIGT